MKRTAVPVSWRRKGPGVLAAVPPIAVFALLTILILGGCGGGGTSSSNAGGGGTTAAPSGAGGETTSSSTKAGGTTTAAVSGETTGTTTNAVNLVLDLTPSRNSGVKGTAVLTELPGQQLEVVLNVHNLGTASGTEHPDHIHQGGTCEDDRAGNGAPVEYPLQPIVTLPNGDGSSTVILQGVSLEQLQTGTPRYVNVHAEATGGDETPPGIACADIPLLGGTGGGG